LGGGLTAHSLFGALVQTTAEGRNKRDASRDHKGCGWKRPHGEKIEGKGRPNPWGSQKGGKSSSGQKQTPAQSGV